MAVNQYVTPLNDHWDQLRSTYICDTEVELPVSATAVGDRAYSVDTAQHWIWNGTAWVTWFSMGEVSYFNTTGTAITISGQSDGSSNMVVIAPASTLTNHMNFDNGGANNGRLRYTGAATQMFHIAATWSASPATNNDTFVLGVAKGGVVNATSKTIQRFDLSTDTHSSALHAMISLATNEYLELYVGNLTAARNVTVKTLNLLAMGM